MTSCKEMRRRAWKTLSGKWFMRLMLVGMIMVGIIMAADRIVLAAFESAEITKLDDFAGKWVAARQQGMCYALPTSRAAFWMFAGFAFETFVGYVFSAIAAFGLAGLVLKAEANRDDRWFADSFGGFARPLEMTWLLVVVNLKVLLWSLLLVFPGIIAAYRYRLAWYLKSERPDMTARECVAESSRLMKGRKWKAFCLDCSFIWWVLALVAIIALTSSGAALAGGCGAAVALIALVGAVASCYLFVKLVMAIVVSRAVFYREVLKEEKA